MLETWIYKTIIAFLSVQILEIVFRDLIKATIKKSNADKVGFIKATIDCLLVSMIPFFRWVFVSLVFILILNGAIIKAKEKEK